VDCTLRTDKKMQTKNPGQKCHVLLPTIGSAGDVHPFLALGICLKERGHRVTLITSGFFKERAHQLGLEFIELGSTEEFARVVENPQVWDPNKGLDIFVKQIIFRLLRPLYEILSEFRSTRTVVAASTAALGARVAEEKFGIPTATVHLQASMMRSLYAMPVPPMTPRFVIPNWAPVFVKQTYFRFVDAGDER